MNNKINIAKILINAPVGTELYSPLFENTKVFLRRFVTDTEKPFPISVTVEGKPNLFSAYGQWEYCPDSECLLFPSKECRNWENFVPSWNSAHRHFEPYEKVLTKDDVWTCNLYSHYDSKTQLHHTIGGDGHGYRDYEIYPYCKSNESFVGKNTFK